MIIVVCLLALLLVSVGSTCLAISSESSSQSVSYAYMMPDEVTYRSLSNNYIRVALEKIYPNSNFPYVSYDTIGTSNSLGANQYISTVLTSYNLTVGNDILPSRYIVAISSGDVSRYPQGYFNEGANYYPFGTNSQFVDAPLYEGTLTTSTQTTLMWYNLPYVFNVDGSNARLFTFRTRVGYAFPVGTTRDAVSTSLNGYNLPVVITFDYPTTGGYQTFTYNDAIGVDSFLYNDSDGVTTEFSPIRFGMNCAQALAVYNYSVDLRIPTDAETVNGNTLLKNVSVSIRYPSGNIFGVGNTGGVRTDLTLVSEQLSDADFKSINNSFIGVDERVDFDGVNFTDWLGSAVDGVFDVELFGVISLGGMLAIVVSCAVAILVLKLFAGG